MWPSKSQRTDGKQRRSTDRALVRPLALLGLVAVLVIAPAAAVTTGGGSPGPATGDAALNDTPTATAGGSVSDSVSGSGSSAQLTHRRDSPTVAENPDPRNLSYGEEVRARVDEDDPRSEEYRGYHDPVSFEGEAGDRITIQMNAGGGFERPRPRPGIEEDGSSIADPYLLLVGPDGDVIAESDDVGRSLNALVSGVVLPEDGEYTIVATSFDEEQTFEYRLSLDKQESGGEDLRSIEMNSTAFGEIDKTDPSSRERRGFYEPVTFQGSAGQAVTIEMGSEPGDTYLILLGPDGREIAENDDSSGLNSTIERVRLPQDGEYTIIATSYSRGDRFRYELSVRTAGTIRDGGGANLREIAVGQTATSELDQADPSAPFLRGFYEPVTVEGRPGQELTISMSSEEGDTYLYLYGPDGNRVAGDDDGGGGLNSQIRTRLEQAGEYTIIATSFDEDATFGYDLSVESDEPEDVDLRSISIGETAEGRIDQDDPRSRVYRGFYEPVTFDGSEGDELTIEMTGEVERTDTYLILVAPNGTVIESNDDFRGLNSRVDTRLPETGEYTIIATSFSPDATFGYELSVRRAGTDRG